MTKNPPTSPGVNFPPPLIYVLGFGFGTLMQKVAPWSLLPASLRTVALVLGWVMVSAGFCLMLWGILTFWGARTALLPHRSASSLVTTGPYRISRNPMYLGLAAAYVGGVFWTNIAWTVLLLPLALLVIHSFVILREERYLEAEFGDAFVRYRSRVRRWI